MNVFNDFQLISMLKILINNVLRNIFYQCDESEISNYT